MTDVHTDLTIEDLYGIDTVRVSLDDIALEAPERTPESILTRVRLSASTAKQVERREAARLRRKQLIEKRRSGKAKKPGQRGKRHHRSKEATRRRQRAHRWATRPFGCLLRGYGAKALDESLWNKHIAPLWEVYIPADLSVRWYSGYGLKDKPYTVYSMDIIHSSLGVVYNGSSQELYDLSCSSELDGVQRA